ncbi:MAG TPA: ATP-binding protein [Tepidisphaeraceae bacterium]|jgi:predicted ATPase|nr:ATP-binding protein [Tepidisphaeraceae bacterium]
MTPATPIVQRIVLTGGPGAGKSVISSHLATAHPDRFVRVPEAATQVYDRLQTRWDKLDLPGRRDVQRQIYRLQVEQENRTAAEHPQKVLLLDRGTIDGAAYWPEGAEAYWQDLGTTHARELNRYDAIIWMETAAALGLYDGDASNTCRFEDAPAAVASGKVLLSLWGGHANLKHVGAFANLADKIATVDEVLTKLTQGAGDKTGSLK